MSLQHASEMNRASNQSLEQRWRRRMNDPNNPYKYTLSDLRNMQSTRGRQQSLYRRNGAGRGKIPMKPKRIHPTVNIQPVNNNFNSLPTLPTGNNSNVTSKLPVLPTFTSELPIKLNNNTKMYDELSTGLRQSIEKDILPTLPTLPNTQTPYANIIKPTAISQTQMPTPMSVNTSVSVSASTSVTETNTDNALVSVILVTDNSRKYIYHSLFTILKQTHKRCEIIVVDNNSTDGTVEYISELADARLKIFSLENKSSLVSCYNLGLYYSKGDYITFLNPQYTNTTERISNQLAKIGSINDICVIADTVSEDEQFTYNYGSVLFCRELFERFGYLKHSTNDNENKNENLDSIFVEYCERMVAGGIKVNTVDDLIYINYAQLMDGPNSPCMQLHTNIMENSTYEDDDEGDAPREYVEFEGKEEFNL